MASGQIERQRELRKDYLTEFKNGQVPGEVTLKFSRHYTSGESDFALAKRLGKLVPSNMRTIMAVFKGMSSREGMQSPRAVVSHALELAAPKTPDNKIAAQHFFLTAAHGLGSLQSERYALNRATLPALKQLFAEHVLYGRKTSELNLALVSAHPLFYSPNVLARLSKLLRNHDPVAIIRAGTLALESQDETPVNLEGERRVLTLLNHPAWSNFILVLDSLSGKIRKRAAFSIYSAVFEGKLKPVNSKGAAEEILEKMSRANFNSVNAVRLIEDTIKKHSPYELPAHHALLAQSAQVKRKGLVAGARRLVNRLRRPPS